MISLRQIVEVIIYLIVAGAVLGLLWWLVDYCGRMFGFQEPFFKFAKVFLVVCAVLILIGLLLSLTGNPVIRW